MPGYESPLGSKKLPSTKLREFTVPDESDSADVEQMSPAQIKAYRDQFRTNIPIDYDSIKALQNKLQQEEDFQQEDPMEAEKQIKEAREARRIKLSGKERLNDGARRRIEMLIGMIRGTCDVEIEGNVFVLETISEKQMREAMMAASEFDRTVESPFEIRRQLLARSLTKVANMDFSQFVGTNDLEAKLQFIESLHGPILQRLYSEYLELVRKTDERYSIKSSDAAREVVNDLKK